MDALLSATRLSREAREREREQRIQKKVAQKCIRRCSRRYIGRRSHLKELTKRLHDLSMLKKVMRNGTGPHTSRSSSGAPSVLPATDVSFALPARQSRGLVLQYLVFGHHESGGSLVLNQEKKQHLLIALCRLVLLRIAS